ncbi:zinc finger protein 160 [Folsomia candida]|uniref:Zinc finger imprinted 3 n=1 Tax=Folsomia candida TaxID=158441 RepID=A0A226DKG0_FOLCA|nr:zinc finger protein 160 [Folsomia candida]OXA45157.1 Zinc finger imprinted 3 [Folsomia candida]
MDLTPRKTFKCSTCCKTFNFKSNLTKHVVTHDTNAQVKRKMCGKISKNSVTLYRHMERLHTTRNRPRCDTCHRVFSNLATLRRHTEAVHNTSERPRLPCGFPSCDKTFLSKYHVSRHEKTEHAENPVRFRCTPCGKEFKIKAHLGQHIPTHTKEKPYNCATCGKSFSHKATMKFHEEMHKSTREVFKCQLCFKLLSTKLCLHRHIKAVHENERNYPCTFCDKTFSHSSHVKRHVEARHPVDKEKIHSCDKFEYKSHSKVNLALHVKRHFSGKHGCYFCERKYVTFPELVKHCGRFHTLEK